MKPKKPSLREARKCLVAGTIEGIERCQDIDNDALAAILQASEELKNAPRQQVFDWLIQQIESWKLDQEITDRDFATFAVGVVFGLEAARRDIKREKESP